jgi:hypothetical protein
MKAKLLSGSSVQYSTCEVTLLASTNTPINDCAGVTVSPTSMTLDVEFELKSSSDVIGSLTGLFAVNLLGSPSTCITFTLYDTANIATTPPSGITFDSSTPQITIQSTYYEALGPIAEKVYSFNLGATANSLTNYSPFTITLVHECKNAAASLSATTLSYDYIVIVDETKLLPVVSHFSLLGEPIGVSCFQF